MFNKYSQKHITCERWYNLTQLKYIILCTHLRHMFK